MKYEIFPTSGFAKELKSLAKKYPQIKDDIKQLKTDLQNNPQLGIPLPKNCFKIRMKITGKLSGKSGASRVITHVKLVENKIYLLSIYDKSEQENNDELDLLLRQI